MTIAKQRAIRSLLSCGFCMRPKIVRSQPFETRAGEPICRECLEEWQRCFKEDRQKSFEFALT